MAINFSKGVSIMFENAETGENKERAKNDGVSESFSHDSGSGHHSRHHSSSIRSSATHILCMTNGIRR